MGDGRDLDARESAVRCPWCDGRRVEPAMTFSWWCHDCLVLFGADEENREGEALRLVTGFFEGDRMKALAWMDARNPLLGGVSPREMCRAGRADKLLRFVKQALAENDGPPEAPTGPSLEKPQ